MGWKLTGIVINKSFINNLPELFDLLSLNDFDLEGSLTFDEMTSRTVENEDIEVGFFGNGTFLSTGVELMTDDKILAKASMECSILAFYINETTSTFCFDFYHRGEYVRKKWISYSDKNIDGSDNFGDLLLIETNEDDDLEIIFKLISSTLDKDFFEIGEDEQMFRFIKVNTGRASNSQRETKRFWKKFLGSN